MFILANLLQALATLINYAVNLLVMLIVVRALISWVHPDPFNPIVQFLHRMTEPLLDPIRRRLPAFLQYGIDVSPIIAFIFLYVARQFLVSTLIDISIRLR